MHYIKIGIHVQFLQTAAAATRERIIEKIQKQQLSLLTIVILWVIYLFNQIEHQHNYVILILIHIYSNQYKQLDANVNTNTSTNANSNCTREETIVKREKSDNSSNTTPTTAKNNNNDSMKPVNSRNGFLFGTCLFYCADEKRLFWTFSMRNTKRVTCQQNCQLTQKTATCSLGLRSRQCNGDHSGPCIHAVPKGAVKKNFAKIYTYRYHYKGGKVVLTRIGGDFESVLNILTPAMNSNDFKNLGKLRNNSSKGFMIRNDISLNLIFEARKIRSRILYEKGKFRKACEDYDYIRTNNPYYYSWRDEIHKEEITSMDDILIGGIKNEQDINNIREKMNGKAINDELNELKRQNRNRQRLIANNNYSNSIVNNSEIQIKIEKTDSDNGEKTFITMIVILT